MYCSGTNPRLIGHALVPPASMCDTTIFATRMVWLKSIFRSSKLSEVLSDGAAQYLGQFVVALKGENIIFSDVHVWHAFSSFLQSSQQKIEPCVPPCIFLFEFKKDFPGRILYGFSDEFRDPQTNDLILPEILFHGVLARDSLCPSGGTYDVVYRPNVAQNKEDFVLANCPECVAFSLTKTLYCLEQPLSFQKQVTTFPLIVAQNGAPSTYSNEPLENRNEHKKECPSVNMLAVKKRVDDSTTPDILMFDFLNDAGSVSLAPAMINGFSFIVIDTKFKLSSSGTQKKNETKFLSLSHYPHSIPPPSNRCYGGSSQIQVNTTSSATETQALPALLFPLGASNLDDGTRAVRAPQLIFASPLSFHVDETERSRPSKKSRYMCGLRKCGPYQCKWDTCTKEFLTLPELTKHLQFSHIPNESVFVCLWKDCKRNGKPFTRYSCLMRHLRYHTGDKPCKCTYEGCGFSSTDNGDLKRHMKIVHRLTLNRDRAQRCGDVSDT